MALPSGLAWRDMETRGFLHVPGFLTPAQLQACVADYGGRPRSINNNFDVPGAGDVSVLKDVLRDVVVALAANTNIDVDRFNSGSYFATKRGIKFEWHQDHESFFLMQSHANYLNFYIPIVKPVREKSNLSIVPFDVLERVSPETYRRAVHAGATTVYPMPNGGELLHHYETGTAHTIPFALDDIACTPELSAGDLLLLRGDVFHRTQDTDTDRVALSLRLASSKTVIRRARLANGGIGKARMMVRNLADYEPFFSTFDMTGKEELTWGELQTLMGQAAKGYPDSPKLYLLKQKIRSGVLWSSAVCALNELVVNRLKYLYHRREPKRTISAPTLAAPRSG